MSLIIIKSRGLNNLCGCFLLSVGLLDLLCYIEDNGSRVAFHFATFGSELLTFHRIFFSRCCTENEQFLRAVEAQAPLLTCSWCLAARQPGVRV